MWQRPSESTVSLNTGAVKARRTLSSVKRTSGFAVRGTLLSAMLTKRILSRSFYKRKIGIGIICDTLGFYGMASSEIVDFNKLIK